MSKSSATSYLVQLDGLRFLAIGLVLVDHFLADINKIPIGPLGVTLFFVLSGFLITRILISSRDKFEGKEGGFGKYLKRFFIRRSLRIFPVYYVCILLLLIFNVPPVREKLGWFVFYGSNIWMAINQSWMGVIDHFWSLSVEEQFYLVFPFVIFLIPRQWFLKTMGIMIVISILFRLYCYTAGYNWIVNYVSMPACLDAFGLGGLMAWLLLYKPEQFKTLFSKTRLVWLSLLLWVFVVYWGKTFEMPKNIATDVWERLAGSVFCFFLIGKAVIGGYTGIAQSFLENSVVLYLGKISYGLYAYHNLVYNHYHTSENHPTLRLLSKITQIAPQLGENIIFQTAYFFGLTVIVSTISWYCMEKPINDLKDKYS